MKPQSALDFLNMVAPRQLTIFCGCKEHKSLAFVKLPAGTYSEYAQIMTDLPLPDSMSLNKKYEKWSHIYLTQKASK